MTTTNTQTLCLVHVLFRHGDRTSQNRAYPNDPHKNVKYEPYGFGQLTNDGKKNIYRLGQIVRKRYKDFLNEEYSPGLIEAWSSNFDRTKVSLQLFLAGLFPPRGGLIWNYELPWQPIPTNYLPREQDKLFSTIFSSPLFRKIYDENYIKSKRGQEIRKKYAKTFEYLSEMTGKKIETTWDVYGLHDHLTTEAEFGLEIPDWAKAMLKGKLREIALLENEMQMETSKLRQVACGKMFEKFMNDTETKIVGESNCKMHIYSGHDLNIGNVLIALGLMYRHVPNYGSCILLEVHNIDGEYVIKVYYRESKQHSFKEMKFPNGQTNLKIDAFRTLVDELRTDT